MNSSIFLGLPNPGERERERKRHSLTERKLRSDRLCNARARGRGGESKRGHFWLFLSRDFRAAARGWEEGREVVVVTRGKKKKVEKRKKGEAERRTKFQVQNLHGGGHFCHF